MIRTTVKVEGMACGMCEAHVNDAVRRDYPVKKVTSSFKKGETVILSEEPIDEARLKSTISEAGYTFVSMVSEPYEKKSFFSRG